uniref:C-type lectin domain-containing protein n=1 Tax=Caenorhabditis tropicalis TaxID=1561998 RepID=A0A1I7U3F0_9PELO
MNVTTAKSLCEKEGSVLTTFENEEERLQLADALIAGLTQKNQKIGSMLLDGRRIPTCETQDLSVLRAFPCNDPTTAFATSDKHTDSTFMFKNWASGEPSSSFYQQSVLLLFDSKTKLNSYFRDIEACIQFTISPNDKRTKKLNDALCDYSKGPGNGATVDFWNFGAACGRVAEFK